MVRFAHPLFAQGVDGARAPAELRAAHAALAAATPSADARARHLAQAADGPDESVAAALDDAAHHARLRGATLDATALFEDAARLTPADDPAAALRRSQLAAECLFVDLSEYVEADRILAAAIERSPAGPARADALSLRAIIRYYHGRVPEATSSASRVYAEAGDDPRRRGVVLGRLAYLVMQRDLERGVALVDEAVALLEPRRRARSIRTPSRTPCCSAPSASSGSSGRRVRATIERGLALITTDGRSWEKEGAEGSAFGLARITDDLDRAIAMTRETIRSKSGPGRRRPVQRRDAVRPAPLPRGLAGGAPRRPRRRWTATSARAPRSIPPGRCAALALVAAHDGRPGGGAPLGRGGPPARGGPRRPRHRHRSITTSSRSSR